MKELNLVTLSLFLVSALSLSGCGEKRSAATGVTVRSQMAQSSAQSSVFSVSDFKFCITQIQIVSDGESGGTTEAILGLVDLSGTDLGTWGSLDIAGQSIDKLKFEIHRDPENCSGANYSLSYKGQELTKDLEFQFNFSPGIVVSAGDSILLSLTNISSALEAAYNAGQFTNESIGNYLESTTEDSGELE